VIAENGFGPLFFSSRSLSAVPLALALARSLEGYL
jgi:hypothetical protein